MAWYYYSGTVVRPVLIKKGVSKAVRPKSKVEILELTTEVQSLIRKGQLRLTSKQKGVRDAASLPVSDRGMKDVVGKSALAKNFAEKGLTKGREIPPVAVGGTEMTEGELSIPVSHAGDADVSGDASEDEPDKDPLVKDVVGAEEVDQVEMLDENHRGKKLKKRRK